MSPSATAGRSPTLTRMTTIAIPRSFDDLTAEWLGEVLRSAGVERAEIAEIEARPIAVGEGFMGRFARLVPRYEAASADAPSSVVVKLPTTEPGGVALGMLLRLWEREARFYAEVAPRLPVRTPRCYYSDADPEAGAFAVVLEDLGALTLGDQVAGLTRDQTEASVDWLARFHGATWGRDDLEEWSWIPRVASDPMYEGLQPMLQAVWPGFVDGYAEVAPPDVIEALDHLIPDFDDLLMATDLPETVIHADFRADNLFFGDDGEVAVIDWQATAYGQALYDLAYFLGASIEVDLRRQAERDLVERYRRSLVDAGAEAVPDRDELFDLYRKSMLTAAAVMALLMGQLDLEADPRGAELARSNVRRICQAAQDLDSAEFSPS